MGENLSKFQAWERDAAVAVEDIKRHAMNLGQMVRRQAQEMADLQVMYGTLCLAAKDLGMKEIPLENPRLVQDGMHEFRARMHTALELYEQWEGMGVEDKSTILDILFPKRVAERERMQKDK